MSVASPTGGSKQLNSVNQGASFKEGKLTTNTLSECMAVIRVSSFKGPTTVTSMFGFQLGTMHVIPLTPLLLLLSCFPPYCLLSNKGETAPSLTRDRTMASN